MPHYVKPHRVVISDVPQLEAIRRDIKSLEMSVVQLADKYKIDLWMAAYLVADCMSHRIRHMKFLPDGGENGWRF